uniref:Putative secreted protein n=1 Tax=Anopheles triannulatus TaxID=58253 RepID=A0A2M4B5D5_9DIPT
MLVCVPFLVYVCVGCALGGGDCVWEFPVRAVERRPEGAASSAKNMRPFNTPLWRRKGGSGVEWRKGVSSSVLVSPWHKQPPSCTTMESSGGASKGGQHWLPRLLGMARRVYLTKKNPRRQFSSITVCFPSIMPVCLITC